ncbi:aryl-sulfate sulfotransferase [Brachyspira pilosicoli]|uniref:Aryl-sulfate sulfotransferase n=1 Tax=Brachyspira pilosicoli TaxID=52584 RepID=A0AAJ6GGP7_BRAPL|nr:aryl-sulfate sulfotransferase [Brachyspira pilosicoli]WIH92398.1 aryl-sulfate sulfotransferase [Brachyspira pilosicoli]WIH94690.1 aryl-sulfate sulfotransferase [Brachyspira pilosicoli]
MKKILSIILLIISLFALSCKNNSSSSIGRIGEITVDPYGVAPLSAVYTTETVNAVPITVKVKGLYGEPDIIHTYPAGYGTEFEIHGMFPESENTIEVNDGGRIITKNVNVGSISANGVTIQKKYDVAVNNLPEEKYKNNPELYIVGDAFFVGISKNGYIRYIMKNYNLSKISIDSKKLYLYPSWGNKIINLLGKTIINYPQGGHHDTIKIDDNYIFCSYGFYGSMEEGLTKIDSLGNRIGNEQSIGTLLKDIVYQNNDPNEIEIFNKIVFGSAVDNYYQYNGQVKNVDWFHSNSLVYDSEKDILYISGRMRGVVAIKYSEWKLLWWMVDNSLKLKIDVTIPSDNVLPYDYHFKDLKSLEPYRVKGDAINDGPKNQHALFLLANGNLGMFDNQGDEATNPNGSRYVEYKITGTHGNYTAQKVYEYRDASLYSRLRSDIDFTGETHQNLLLCYADNNAKIIEVEKETKKILFRLYLPFGSYRVDKMPLYYDEGRVYSEDCNLKNLN